MKKLQLILKAIACFLWLIPGTAWAEIPKNTELGDISMEEMEMTVYPKDSSAPAVYFFELAKMWRKNHVEENGFQYHARYKILSEEALNLANYTLPIRSTENNFKAMFRKINIVTYNLVDGKIVATPFNTDDIMIEEVYDDTRNNFVVKEFKIAIPDVKVGSVVEIAYTLTVDRTKIWSWRFQKTVPVAWSEYEISYPDEFIYQQQYQGYTPLVVNETKVLSSEAKKGSSPSAYGSYFDREVYVRHRTFSHWAAEDVPGFDIEDYITTPLDYLTSMNLYLIKANFTVQYGRWTYHGIVKGYDQPQENWNEVRKMLMDHERFGEQLKVSGFVKAEADSIMSAHTADNERLQAAHQLVNKRIEWDEKHRIWIPETVRRAWNQRKGNSAEINFALVLLLREMGYTANPVIVATRFRGRPNPLFPILSDYNSVVCSVYLNGKYILMDACQNYLPYNELPMHFMTGEGRLVNDETILAIDLNNKEKKNQYILSNLTMDEAGNMSGKVSCNYKSIHSYNHKKEYVGAGNDQYLDSLKAKLNNFTVSGFSTTGVNEDVFKNEFSVSSDSYVLDAGDKFYLGATPFYGIAENPFKEEERLYPVDFGVPVDETTIYQFTLPEGFAVEEHPEPIMVRLPDNSATYLYHVNVLGNSVHITSKLNINKTMFLPEEYKQLRSFYDQIVAKQAEQIVLTRN